MKRLYALKSLTIQPGDKDFATHHKYFCNEISIHSTLRHPYLVDYIDTFEDAGTKYLLIEYIEGNLYDFMLTGSDLRAKLD